MAKGEQEIVEELRPVWELNKMFCLRRGIDLPNELMGWALKTEKKLGRVVAQDFKRLTEDGCSPQMLALSMAALALAPEQDDHWRDIVGPSRRRGQTIRSLENAARSLESMSPLAMLGSGESDKPFSSSVPTLEELPVWLRLYAEFLQSAGKLKLGGIPIVHMCKYGFSGYVETKTAKPHHKEVAALISASLREANYNETSHKMWRYRNIKRLRDLCPLLPQYLSAFDILLTTEK